jgi:hypothetical protein
MIDYAILTIDTNGTITPIDLDTRTLDLKRLQTLVGGFIEVVHPVPFGGPIFDDVVMIVDDEGKLKDKPVNVLASALYNGYDPIVGDVVLCCIDTRPVPDIYALPSATAQPLFKFLNTVRDGVLRKFGTLKPE